MRLLPIPVPADLPRRGPPWWLGRNSASSFTDVFRAFFPTGQVPKGLEPIPEAGGFELRILEIHWIRISYARTVRSGLTFSGRPTKAAPPASPRDPLVVDLDGQGPRTTGASGARSFDLAGTGNPLPTSFVQGNSAFLALDANGNGRIDSGAELFGDQHGAPDGYEELRKYDLNADGQINAEDPVFSSLKLWFGDGRLTSVTEAGLRAFSLQASPDGHRTQGGDPIFRHATALTLQGGTLHTYALGLNQFSPGPTSATLGPVPP